VKERPVGLLFSPSVEGHRVIYCRVFARVLDGLGYDVVVAGRLGAATSTDPLLAELGRRPGVSLLDIGGGRGGPTGLGELSALVERTRVGLTVLLEADDLMQALAARRERGSPALGGRVVGVFIRSTNHQYAPAPSPVARAKRLLRGRRAPLSAAAFHRDYVARRPVVDAALVLDELYAAGHRGSHAWLPDIYREFEPAGEAWEREAAEWAERVRGFLAGCPRRPVVVYVGANQRRRGYADLLRLALGEDGCFLHCGERDDDDESSDEETRALRRALAERGALLETGDPYLGPETADVFLRAARCIALPYRNHDGSSGIMLQALAAGRPVLVPDRGLMAYRLRTFGLGLTYRAGDDADLRARFRELQAQDPERWAPALRAYCAHFAPEQVAAAVSAAVTGCGTGARLPQDAAPGPGPREGGES
jgi:glycosyltransferase involved in cell wall biosynthesis